jgi:vacuolar-type H+-ATPase subunit I/STV1
VHVITGPNVAPIVLRHVRPDGQWQVALRVVSSLVDAGVAGRQSEESTKARLAYLERVREALSYVARRVGEKRIDTPAAARKELDDAMKRAAEQKDVPTERASEQ